VGLVVSLILIAVGAILTWGINSSSQDVNVDAIGVILMIVGLVGLVLTMLFWQSWLGAGMWRRGYYAEGGAPPARGWGRGRGRTYVVEEEETAPPPGPPPGGPPPP